MSGLNQLDPVVAQAEQQIEKQKLPPDKAVDYLLSKGVDPRLASLVMKYRMLKQASGNQAQKQPQTTVSQDVDNQINAMTAQRGQGISGLPVPNNTFNMASGGIIAFDDGGPASAGTNMGFDPSDYSAQMQNQFLQNLMTQQTQQQAGTIAQGMAEGGEVDDDDSESDLQAQTAAIYKRQLADWQRSNAQNYLAKGQKLGVAPPQVQQNAKGGRIKHFDGFNGSIVQADSPDDSQITPPGQGRNLEALAAQEAAKQRAIQDAQDKQLLANPTVPRGRDLERLAQLQGAQSRQAPPPVQPAPPAAPPPPPKPTGNQPLPAGGFASVIGATGAQPPAQTNTQSQPQPNITASASMSNRGPDNGPWAQQLQKDVAENQRAAQEAQSQIGSVKGYADQLMNTYESQGIGAAAKEHLAYLDQLQGQFNKLEAKGNSMALIQLGLGIAQEATRNPHGGFLGALAVGGQEGARAYQENISKYQDLRMKVGEARYQVQEAQENVKLNADKEAVGMYNNAVNRADMLTGRLDVSRIKAVEMAFGKEAAENSARAMIASRYQSNLPVETFNALLARGESIKEAYEYVNEHGPQNTAAQTRSETDKAMALERIKGTPTYNMALNQSLSSNPDIAAKGRAELQRLENIQGGPSGGSQGDIDISRWGTPTFN